MVQGLFLDWFWSKKIMAALDQPLFLGVFTEIWQQLRGSRVAVYRNVDERRLGLFNVLAILDTDDAASFLTTLRGLARLADPMGLKLSALTPARTMWRKWKSWSSNWETIATPYALRLRPA